MPSKDTQKSSSRGRLEDNEQEEEEKKRGKRRWIFCKPSHHETTIQHNEAKNLTNSNAANTCDSKNPVPEAAEAAQRLNGDNILLCSYETNNVAVMVDVEFTFSGSHISDGVLNMESLTRIGESLVQTRKGKPVYGGVSRAIQSNYGFSATADQLHYNPNIVIFFLENDLKKYTKMTLRFTRITTSTIFLPRQVAEKIPFSSKKMPQILDYFSVKPNSMEAKTIKQTIKECEKPGIKGEEKYCATSLESMLFFK
ncbi:uncharacterized protein LOC114311889 [Camellia sinensis]|uniref:uncharacterized protein LOC114311889 n=1 Tax=Camellia sinensis TaxID=4442 RepID=UPI001035C5CF|nr:uncharacterized protein LOC114311889 [Camellia sinensis]